MLVVVSIAIGVLALGLTTSTSTLLNRSMDRSRLASHSAHARMGLETPFDDDVVEAIENLPEVAEAAAGGH